MLFHSRNIRLEFNMDSFDKLSTTLTLKKKNKTNDGQLTGLLSTLSDTLWETEELAESPIESLGLTWWLRTTGLSPLESFQQRQKQEDHWDHRRKMRRTFDCWRQKERTQWQTIFLLVLHSYFSGWTWVHRHRDSCPLGSSCWLVDDSCRCRQCCWRRKKADSR